MKTIPLTKGCEALVSDEDYDVLSQHHWHLNSAGYAARMRGGGSRSERKVILMHREILQPPPKVYVDHINRNKLDNRRENLRECTNGQNMAYAPPARGKTSPYKGVSWDRRNKKWVAYIRDGRRYRNLGRFEREDDAARAYDIAALALNGPFAFLNFPREALRAE